MTTYQEIRAYSPQFDCTTARISMADANNQEFFMLVPQRDARCRRAERYAAIEAIQEAMGMGLVPGEVRMAPADWKAAVAAQEAA